MGLFEIIGICQVIFCKLVVLCTQSACYWFHSVPRCFHLQTSEKVIFVTVTMANVVFYWVMVLHAGGFLSMNFLLLCQFIAEPISLQVAPPYFRWFQKVPACLKRFQLAQGGSSLFQVVPARFSSFVVLVSALSMATSDVISPFYLYALC